MIGIFILIAVWVLAIVFGIIAAVAANQGQLLHLPARDQVRELIGLSQRSRRRTTASASSRPRRVSTSRPARAARAVDEAVGDELRDDRGAPSASSASSGEAVGDPDAEQHVLDRGASASSSVSRPAAGETPAASALGVGGGVLDVPPAHAADVAVRAGADAPPVLPGPVARGCAASGATTSRAQLLTSYQS